MMEIVYLFAFWPFILNATSCCCIMAPNKQPCKQLRTEIWSGERKKEIQKFKDVMLRYVCVGNEYPEHSQREGQKQHEREETSKKQEDMMRCTDSEKKDHWKET